MITSATKPSYSSVNDRPFGPAKIEHRTADSGLEELGTYFMVFHSDEHSDPWTVEYEETVFVIEGEARFIVLAGGEVQQLVAAPNELLVLPKGTTVRYGATVGTRLLLSISPVNWRTSS